MIAALLCAIVGLAVAALLPGGWSVAALPFLIGGWWLLRGGGQRWLEHRTSRHLREKLR